MNKYRIYGLKQTGADNYPKTTDIALFLENKKDFSFCEEVANTTEETLYLKDAFRHYFGEENITLNNRVLTLTKTGAETYFTKIRAQCAQLARHASVLPIRQFIYSPAMAVSYRDLKHLIAPEYGDRYYYNGLLFNITDFAKECWMLMDNTKTESISFTLEQVFSYY